MNTEQKISNPKLRLLLIILFSLGVLYFFVTSLVDNRFREIELHTREQIAEQQALLSTIAEITARNGADSITESVVKDCSVTERSRFDNLLSRLDSGLPHTDLVELERLFGRCASFFSERKSVMVARLSREIEIYQNYVDQLGVIIDEDTEATFLVTKWQALATEERKQSDFFSDLVRLQDEIITTLLTGKQSTSPEIAGILQQVKEVQETLLEANNQASIIRSELIPL